MSYVSKLDYNFYFSAPTNKAAKVLQDYLGVPTRTTYSLLGLRMVAQEDKRVLQATSVPDLGVNPILVIDEAGTLQKNLIQLLVDVGFRVLFVGDPAQLNPIGERMSQAWKLVGSNKVMLKKVERYDNQLLTLSMKIRKCLKNKNWTSPLSDDNNGSEGVFRLTKKAFERSICELPAEAWDQVKGCSWRNRSCEGYTNMIREALGFNDDYNVGDRILLASPLEFDGSIVAHTDEEFVIKEINKRVFRFDPDGYEIEAYALDVDREFSLYVPINLSAFETRKQRLASAASSATPKERKLAWAKFWEFVNTFSLIRHGYWLTSHRLQGSSVNRIFLDPSDILANPNKSEAFRSLYVGATRPRVSLTYA